MAKFYGDLPCTKLNGTIHLTVSANRLACGGTWRYNRPDRSGKFHNIIWRDKAAITCPECLVYLEKHNQPSR